MTIPTGTVLKLVAEMVWDDGEINQNVFNAIITGGAGPWDVADVLDDALDWLGTMYANLDSHMHPDLTGSRGILYEFDTFDDDWDEVGSFNWTFIPSGAGDPLPRGVACLINAKTVNADVSGKKYLPGTLEGRLTDSLWTSSQTLGASQFAADWTDPFSGFSTGATWTPQIWSVATLTAREMTGSVNIPTIPAYQRRRKNLVGI